MAMSPEKLARQRALRSVNGNNEELKRVTEIKNAPSARADAEVKAEAAEATLNEVKAELKAAQREYGDLDKASFGGRFKDMQMQASIAAIEHRIEKAQQVLFNALEVLSKVEAKAKATRMNYYRHKKGAAYLESIGRRKQVEQAISRLEQFKDDPEIAPIIVEKQAQLRGIDNLHLAALQEYADTYRLLTGKDIAQAPEPTEDELNPAPVEITNLHGRPRNAVRIDRSGQYS